MVGSSARFTLFYLEFSMNDLTAQFRITALLPRPRDLQPNSKEMCGRSLHFIERDKKLIVSYLNHGILFVSPKSSSLQPYD